MPQSITLNTLNFFDLKLCPRKRHLCGSYRYIIKLPGCRQLIGSMQVSTIKIENEADVALVSAKTRLHAALITCNYEQIQSA